MEITKRFYAPNRAAWRAWLNKYHKTAKEIWLIYYKRGSGKPRVEYSDAVEEALCFGWIDSILKPIDHRKYAQRFTPRKPGSKWSEMNRVRVRRLVKAGLMTPAGLAVYDAKQSNLKSKRAPKASDRIVIPKDIRAALKREKTVWQNFHKFPLSYKRIRIWWIEAARKRPAAFNQRLKYFLRMTAKNKMFGMVQ